MSISTERLHEHAKSIGEMKGDLEAELAAISERVERLEGLIGTSGADNSKLEQRLETERGRREVLKSAASSCDRILADLQSYGSQMQGR
jgi:chromosome segregation ATPase